MIKTLNRFGEIDFNKNEALFTIPLLRLSTEEVEIIEENYRKKIKEIDYKDTFIYANHISSIRDRLQLSFDLTGSVDFHHLHKLKFKEVLPYLQTAIEIAKVDVNVLWEKNNFVVDLEEKRIKAILFEFESFPIYKNDERLDGLKEIFLLALTKVDRILGKPKRSDFIEQTDRVIQFTEDILRAINIEDIERILSSYQREIEYEELRVEQAEKEKRENSKMAVFMTKFQKPKKEVSPEETIKNELHKKFEGKTSNKVVENKSFIDKITSPKGMLVTIGVLFVGIAVYVIGDFGNEESAKAKEEKNFSTQIKQKEQVLEAYRLYIEGSEESIETAYARLDNVGYNNLSKKDKSVLIDWYLEQDQYTKAIATDRNSSYKIGDKLSSEEEGLEKLEEIASSIEENEVLTFDIALMKNQYQIMIENSKIKFNDRRAKKIVEAYVMTNQIEEMKDFVASYKESDEKSYDNLYKYSDRLTEKYVEKRELTEEIKLLSEEIEKTKSAHDAEKDKEKKDALNKTHEEQKKQLDTLKEKINAINESIQND